MVLSITIGKNYDDITQNKEIIAWTSVHVTIYIL